MKVILALILFPLLDVTSACTCAEPSLHHQMCGEPNKFLIRCTVLSKPPEISINDDVHYSVNILEKVYDTFQVPVSNITAGSNVTLCTPGNDGVCRATLTLNEEYYLAGKLDVADVANSKLRIQLCDFQKKPTELKPCQKDMIKKINFGCSCMGTHCKQYC